MKFSVTQSALAQAVTTANKGISSNSTLPVLSGILITAREGTVEFQTSDLTVSIRHKAPANIEEEGVCVVSGRIMANIVKALPDAAVTLESDERQATITCGKSRYRLNTISPDDFPEFPELDLERSIELPSDLLGAMAGMVHRFTSKDVSRPILAGVLLAVEGQTVRMVSTDSYRLAVCESTAEGQDTTEPFEVIVNGATLHDVLGLPGMTESITVGMAGNQVVFSFGNTVFVSRRIEGPYPNYRGMLPTSHVTSVELSSSTFADALRRVSVVAQPNSSVHMEVDVDGQLMVLSAMSQEQGDSREEVDVQAEGESATIALNHRYVLDYVGLLKGDGTFVIELQSSMQPAVFRSSGKVSLVYLLMPMRE